jgi:hypothetical protein
MHHLVPTPESFAVTCGRTSLNDINDLGTIIVHFLDIFEASEITNKLKKQKQTRLYIMIIQIKCSPGEVSHKKKKMTVLIYIYIFGNIMLSSGATLVSLTFYETLTF